MLGEIRGQFDSAISGAVNSSPELMKEKLKKEFRKTASSAASIERTLDSVERGFSDDELEVLISGGLAEIDFQELASTVSRFCELTNRIYEINPDIIKGLLSQFFSSLDSLEAAETVGLIAGILLNLLSRLRRCFFHQYLKESGRSSLLPGQKTLRRWMKPLII
jgi:hypothetical protein